MMRQFELVDKVSGYLSNLDENLLNQAYVFTVKKHVFRTPHAKVR